jgi:hypothetical protein
VTDASVPPPCDTIVGSDATADAGSEEMGAEAPGAEAPGAEAAEAAGAEPEGSTASSASSLWKPTIAVLSFVVASFSI